MSFLLLQIFGFKYFYNTQAFLMFMTLNLTPDVLHKNVSLSDVLDRLLLFSLELHVNGIGAV